MWSPDDLSELTAIGVAPLSREEALLAAQIGSFAIGARYAALRSANFAAEGEWRWANDRSAFVAEVERKRAEDQARLAADRERWRTRLRGLTLEKLLSETPFERWSSSPPFPPPEFTAAACDAIHDACRRIRELGPKPRKAAVRKVLRDCVLWFNRADDEAGGVIETEEREDIWAALEEIAHAAGQKSLVEEIDEWRDW